MIAQSTKMDIEDLRRDLMLEGLRGYFARQVARPDSDLVTIGTYASALSLSNEGVMLVRVVDPLDPNADSPALDYVEDDQEKIDDPVALLTDLLVQSVFQQAAQTPGSAVDQRLQKRNVLLATALAAHFAARVQYDLAHDTVRMGSATALRSTEGRWTISVPDPLKQDATSPEPELIDEAMPPEKVAVIMVKKAVEMTAGMNGSLPKFEVEVPAPVAA